MRRAVLLLCLLLASPANGRNTPAQRAEVSAALAWAPPAPAAAPPVTLTASDGTGLRLRSVEAQSVVTDPLAFTELTLTFENPEDRVREGRFEITLPDNAAISRFAMKIGDRWQEGEILEKQRAKRVYEDFLHREQDPALLESDAGNRFRARIFPIPAGGVKELLISYSQELVGAEEPWRLPLQGLPKLDTLDVTVSVSQSSGVSSIYTVTDAGVVPEGDLALVLDTPQVNVGLRSGSMAVARVRPLLELPAAPLEGLTVLVDTSASRALGFDEKNARLSAIMSAVAADAGNIPVQVYAFDQALVPLYSGRARGFGRAAGALGGRTALGASDLAGALTGLQGQPVHDRMLLVTDGVFTAGPTEAEALHAALTALPISRLDVLVDGGIRDEAVLSALVTAGLPAAGIVLDADLTPAAIADRLGAATASGVEVTVPGAEWVWPQTLDGIQSGDDRLVYAWLPADRALSVSLDGARVVGPLRTAEGEEPLLERALVQADIARLTAQYSETGDADLYAQIVSMSVAYRVLSDFTAMLVLETERDYERYRISRTSLSDILTIRDHDLHRVARADWVLPSGASGAVHPEWARRDRPASGGRATEQDASADEMRLVETTPVVDTQSGDRGSVLTSDFLQRIPTSRSYQSAVQMAAGVTGGPNPSLGGAASSATAHMREVDPIQGMSPPDPQKGVDPWEGRFAEVMQRLEHGQTVDALAEALAWRTEAPGDVLALLALGEALTAAGDRAAAARAYGSIIDLFPSRADMRRMAGQRLESLGDVGAALAADTYRVAVAQRPDHPSSHRLYAWSLARLGRLEDAVDALTVGLSHRYHSNRFAGVDSILRGDLEILGAMWLREDPAQAEVIRKRLAAHGAQVATAPSVRLLLHWETDTNDVDLHIYDSRLGHAYYAKPRLTSGGELLADVTTGYGPECFSTEKLRALPWTIQAHYYSRGPMGYGMGTLQIVAHDGTGRVAFEDRPFVIMTDQATIDLGTIDAPLVQVAGRR